MLNKQHYPLPRVVTQRTVYRWQERVRDETHTHISTDVHGFESLCCSEMLEKVEISGDCKVTCPLCKIIWQDCQAFELCDFSNNDQPPPVTMPELSGVDPDIRALVTALNLNAFQTYASCQGHGFPAYNQKPYVAFIAPEEATKVFARRLREDAESFTPKLRWGWEVTASFNSDFVLCYRLQPTNPHCRVDRYRHRSFQQDFTTLVSFLN